MSHSTAMLMRDLAAQFLELAEKQGATGSAHGRPSPHGHVLAAVPATSWKPSTFRSGIALYNPAEHRPLATRFGLDIRVATCPIDHWPCGCLVIPTAALADTDQALKDAREIGQAATLMYALSLSIIHVTSSAEITRGQTRRWMKLTRFGGRKRLCFWKAIGDLLQGAHWR